MMNKREIMVNVEFLARKCSQNSQKINTFYIYGESKCPDSG
jgi:hypothetical protein|tara:strand:- start:1532 stop:1654 length:123 start_codon:yes stop_codon:yes gene_type:complete